ncbi:DNA ligase 4 [Diplonema papillatum]|nr:DNA ligase 4 [Diplonema papillatum]
MLAGLVTKEKFENLLQTEKYTVEPKYDGERMILHYQREPFRLVYLTRNAKDYTDIYGPKFNKSAMASIDRCEDCILDGEVLVWKKSINAFKPFGTNKTFALDAEMTRAGDDADEQFCYMCFDLLYLNGEVLTEYTLEQRRARLAGVVTPQRKKFELVPCLPAVNVRAVFQALDESVQNGFEGVVLKNVNSPYKPAERKLNWLKLKRDHIEGLADTMDLVILGGYYGTKFGRVHVSHFVLGVYCEKERIWYTFTKVGTGYTQVELAVLMSKLERHWKKYDRAHPPPHLGPWKPAADDVPDLWIDPAESVVLEIIGYSFQETTKFLVGRTVRFPRVKHIRTDKTAADAATLEQVVQLMNESNQQKKLAAGLGADYALTRQKRAPAEATLAGGPPVAGSKAKRVAGLLQANTENYMANRPADAVWRSRCKSKGVKVFAAAAPSAGQCALVGGGAEPLRFCVLHSDRSLPKEVLESLIVAHGGDVVPHPVMKSIPVASSAASAKVQHWRAAVESSGSNPGASHKYQHRYVLHHSWIVDCVEAGTLLPCTPRYMVYISPEVQEIFSKTIDKYGDSFVQPSTVESLRSVIDQALASDAGAADKQPADKKSGKKQPKPDDGFTAKIKPTGLKWDPTSTQEAYCVLAELGLVQQGGRKRPLDTGEGDPTGAPGASPLKKRAKEPDSLDDTRPQVGTAAGSLDAGAASGLLSAKKARYAEADLLFTDLVLRFPPPDLLASCSWLQLQLTTAALFNATITFPTPPPTSDATAACKPAPVQLHYAITDESQPSLLLYNREQVHGRVTHTDTPMYPRPLEPLCPLLDCKWIEDSIAAGVLLPTEAYAVPIANLNLSPAAGRGPAESPPDLPIAVVDDRKVGRGQTSCELFSSGSTGHGDPDNACPADTMIGALDNDGDTLHELMDADVS